MGDLPIIYGLENFQTRALAPQVAETEKINFLVGTQSIRNVNQVQLIEFDDDSETLNKRHFEHSAGEVWSLTSASQDPSLLATVYYKTQDYHTDCGASVWRMPLGVNATNERNSSEAPLERLCDLVDSNEAEKNFKIHSVSWAPENDSRLITTVDNQLILWDLNSSSKEAKISSRTSAEGKSNEQLGVVRWSSHQAWSQVASTFGTSIIAFDIRSMERAWTIDNAHLSLTRDVDYNPNKQYYLASCGDDGAIKIWDVRNCDQPVLSRTDHSHWVWSVRFNQSYDQLLLSCSSDQRVILSNLPSAASQPIETTSDSKTDKRDTDTDKFSEDAVLHSYEDHEESVYAVEWSSGDFWTFASISFDGRFVINKVPKNFKYKQFM